MDLASLFMVVRSARDHIAVFGGSGHGLEPPELQGGDSADLLTCGVVVTSWKCVLFGLEV